jgi:hypothetical protein
MADPQILKNVSFMASVFETIWQTSTEMMQRAFAISCSTILFFGVIIFP